MSFLLTELNEVMDQLTLHQAPLAVASSRQIETTDTSGEDTAGETPHAPERPRRSKKAFKLKRSHAMCEMGSFFVTGSTDAASKPSHFYCPVCKKDISISAKGSYEILRHYQGSRHYPHDRRMRLTTPGWRVLDFFGNPLSESDLALVRDEILKAPLHQLGQEFPFPEDLILDSEGRVNTKMPLLAKVSSLIDVLKLGGSYELLEKLWRQFQLTSLQDQARSDLVS